MQTDPSLGSAQDPRDVVAKLIATCQAEGRRLKRIGADDAASGAVRRCSIELTLLAEACGTTVPAANRRLAQGQDDASAGVLREYRAAMRTPLPRGIREVLRDHLDRLERGVSRLAAA
jgi:hypothetical protein